MAASGEGSKRPPKLFSMKRDELFALAESEEEAKGIADLYQISLIRFFHGVAVFHVEEDPSCVIARGIRNGWPRLEMNHTIPVQTGETERTATQSGFRSRDR